MKFKNVFKLISFIPIISATCVPISCQKEEKRNIEKNIIENTEENFTSLSKRDQRLYWLNKMLEYSFKDSIDIENIDLPNDNIIAESELTIGQASYWRKFLNQPITQINSFENSLFSNESLTNKWGSIFYFRQFVNKISRILAFLNYSYFIYKENLEKMLETLPPAGSLVDMSIKIYPSTQIIEYSSLRNFISIGDNDYVYEDSWSFWNFLKVNKIDFNFEKEIEIFDGNTIRINDKTYYIEEIFDLEIIKNYYKFLIDKIETLIAALSSYNSIGNATKEYLKYISGVFNNFKMKFLSYWRWWTNNDYDFKVFTKYLATIKLRYDDYDFKFFIEDLPSIK
ncbi:hypothetical protein ACUZ9N_01990 [Mycoplasmopsis gallinarum]